jgi:antitoxin PrlF
VVTELEFISRNSYTVGMKKRSVVSEKGQVTIPKAIRDRLGIRAGEAIEFREDGGRLIIEKASRRDALDELYGIVDLKGGTDKFVRELRDPAGSS